MNYYPLYTDPLFICLTVGPVGMFVAGIMYSFMNNHRR